MKQIRLHSENNDFQYAETLKHNRNKRHKFGEFLVEGVRNINQAVEHDWPIRAFYSSADKPLSNWAQATLERTRAEKHFLLPAALMEKLSDKEQTSELLALVLMLPDELARIRPSPGGRTLVLDRPGNPGNLGTVLRSADAFRVDGVVVSGHAVDLYDPQVVRASVGSFFAVSAVRLPSHHELVPWIQGLRGEPEGLSVVGTSAKATTELRDYPFRGRTVIVLGNETTGMSAAYRAMCDDIVTIPMAGTASSINVSCAASIVLYEAHLRARERQTDEAAGKVPSPTS
jgi:tRNA G18 (ribose-2'-O)-methylase SpoU